MRPASRKVEWSLVDADPELERDRDRAGGLDRRAHDRAQQARLERDRRAAALARHLAHRAAEVHVDVVDPALADQDAHRLADVARVDAVELQAADLLLRVEAREQQRLAVALDERARRDHLAHVEPGAVAPAERPERRVRDARHRRQHDRRPDLERSDPQRDELPRPRRRHVTVRRAPIPRFHRACPPTESSARAGSPSCPARWRRRRRSRSCRS